MLSVLFPPAPTLIITMEALNLRISVFNQFGLSLFFHGPLNTAKSLDDSPLEDLLFWGWVSLGTFNDLIKTIDRPSARKRLRYKICLEI